jgi:nitroreductase
MCPRYVFKPEGGKAVYANIPGAFCNMCGHCIAACPADALTDPASPGLESLQPDIFALPSPEALQLLLRARRSIRAFKPDPIPEETLDKILEAGRYTATGGNQQNIRYTVISSPAEVASFRDRAVPIIMKTFERFENKFYFSFKSLVMGKKNAEVPRNYLPILRLYQKRRESGDDRLFYHAAAIIIVHTDKHALGGDFSSSAALYNCSLMAHLLGIGCCFNGFLQISINRSAVIKEWLGIPGSHRCHGAMILGYQNVKFKRLINRNKPVVNQVKMQVNETDTI